MLLSMAPLASPSDKGIVILLQKNWSSSATLQAENMLSSFFESYLRLRADKESTKPYLALYSYPLISDIESSGEICKRKMSLKSRDNSELYYLLQDKKASSLRLHAKLPEWAHATLCDKNLNFYKWDTQDKKDGWAHIKENPSVFANSRAIDLGLHLFHTPDKDSISIHSPLQLSGTKHYRVADLILRSKNSFLAPSYSVCIE